MKKDEGSRQTLASLTNDLEGLGVVSGSTLIVHSSLRSIGWVDGGAPTLVQALIDTLGPAGTLAMPAATPEFVDPATPGASEAEVERARGELPLFDRMLTPTSLGVVPETFRKWPKTLRSDHPLESVCARGPAAEGITGEHPLAFSEGRGGPFDKLHELDSWILLLGVGFNRCTALHYAESIAAKRRTTTVHFPLMEKGRRTWMEVPNVANDNDTHFPMIGEEFTIANAPLRGTIGRAPSTLCRMRELVTFAVAYFERVL